MPLQNKEISVCFVADYSILIGGKERQLLEILKFMKASGYQFVVISLSSRGLLYKKLLQDFGDNTILIDRQKKGFYRTALTFRSFIKSKNYKVYHSLDNLSILYILLASVNLPIKIINGSIRHSGVNKSLNYLFDFVLLQLSTKIIANSLEGLKYYRIKNGEVVYNAVDSTRFVKTQGRRNSVIMTANFSDYKDHGTFFSATAPMVKAGVLDRVGLLGDGPYLKHWQKHIEGICLSEFYVFHGHRDDVEKVLAEYGTGVLCSTIKYKEGISNSILEYMGSGLLVISSDAGATKEIIRDEVNGLLFETEDSNDLKNKLEWALIHSQECETMIQMAYQTLQDKFSYETNMQKLISIYTSMDI